MINRLPLSIIIMTKNEELHIRKCLESVSFADEIFVVDSRSTDKTTEIAKKYTDKIVPFVWNGKWPKKKNWCLMNLPFSYEWVLMLDADEEVTENAKKEIVEILINGTECAAFIIRFYYIFLGHLIKHGDPVRKLILFKHKLTRFSEFDNAPNREVEGSEQPIVKGKIGILNSPFIHNNLKGINDFFKRHNAYSTRAAHLIFSKKSFAPSQNMVQHNSTIKRRNLLKSIFVNIPFKPLAYFSYSYFFRLGFLDAKAGFYFNLCKAFYHFQVDLKLKELIINSRQRV